MTVPHRQPLAERSSAACRRSRLLLSGRLATGIGPVDVRAQDAPVARLEMSDPFGASIAEAAQRFDLPASWIRAIMRAESAVDATAVSPKGAMGLMQIMPETWAELRLHHHLGGDPFDPRDNILAGAAYLRELNDRYGAPGLLAAYHAGPARYEAYLAGRPLPAETRAYVAMLAPAFGGGELPAPASTSAADRQSWRGAPLFVSQQERPPAADGPTTTGPAGGRLNTRMRDAAAGFTPQPEGLFIGLSGARGRP